MNVDPARSATGARDRPGAVAPPPLIYLAFLVAAFLLSLPWPLALGLGDWRHAGALAMFALGAAVAIAAMRSFRAAGTSFNVYKPDTALLTEGVFRYSRNPLYVSVSLAYLSIAVATDSGWALLLLAPALAVVRYGVIAREEAYLAAKFGADYEAYRRSVRRWL